MWTTKKSLVRQVIENQDVTNEKIDKIEKKIFSNNELIENRLILLENKIDAIEQREVSYFQTCTEKMLLLENKIDETNKLLYELTDSLENKLSDSKKEILIQFEKLNNSKKEITEIAKKQIDFIYQKMDEKHKESIDISTSLENVVSHSMENIKSIDQAIKAIVEELKDGNSKANSIMQFLENVNKEEATKWKSINDAENVSAKNIAIMNQSLQEILKCILSLDEGNRLIIAKLLLQNLEA